jgi:EAL domain-containing protein (putative c-di-GMP-specific phosphodiesterase class I)
MGLATVAEGIETSEQAAVLRQLGCGYGQGYHFAKPMSSSALGRLIDQSERLHRGGLSPASEPPARSVIGR